MHNYSSSKLILECIQCMGMSIVRQPLTYQSKHTRRVCVFFILLFVTYCIIQKIVPITHIELVMAADQFIVRFWLIFFRCCNRNSDDVLVTWLYHLFPFLSIFHYNSLLSPPSLSPYLLVHYNKKNMCYYSPLSAFL